ncbi:hypothetical protein [Myroides sp. DW712]|uniref:hypothetical protein n=1 Tax=Myroides sp. DW712 TaxID=3389800 RepID=UPI003979DC50
MKNVIDVEWFKSEFSTKLKGYDLEYKFFNEGDLGSLNQIEFNSKKIGGNIDFWSLGWIGVFVWDFEAEVEILNVLLESHQEKEKQEIFRKLEQLL